MLTKLRTGDRVIFRSEKGLRLRGIVCDGLPMKASGEELMVPVQRPRSGKAGKVAADGHHIRGLVTRWIPRSKLRKLPALDGWHCECGRRKGKKTYVQCKACGSAANQGIGIGFTC